MNAEQVFFILILTTQAHSPFLPAQVTAIVMPHSLPLVHRLCHLEHLHGLP